jgi:hypothetical protein
MQNCFSGQKTLVCQLATPSNYVASQTARVLFNTQITSALTNAPLYVSSNALTATRVATASTTDASSYHYAASFANM